MSGATSIFGSSGRTSSKNLVEFRAGKMYMKGKMVHPDKRKGTVYIYQSDDSLMHFCWKERKSSSAEDDLIIFPDDTEFKKVPQCNTGRVFVLKFKSSSRKLFFWMQEPKTDKDESHLQKVNDMLNNPPTPGSSRSGGSGSGGIPSELSNLGDGDLQNLLNSMNQQQLMQLFGGGMGGLAGLLGRSSSSSRPSTGSSAVPATSASSTSSTTSTTNATTTSSAPATSSTSSTTATSSSVTASTTSSTKATTATTTSASSSSSGAIQLSDLQNILSGLSVPAGAEADARPNVDLSSAVTAEALQPILSNPEFISRLQQFLPQIGNTETLPTVDQLKGTLQSPQFHQAMSLFSAALQSGQLGPLIQQFGLGDGAVEAATQGNMEAFVEALQDKKGKKKDDEEDDMALD